MVAVGLFGACCSYLASSAGMSIFNKLAITALPLPITLVLIQMVFTVATTLAGWRAVHIGSRRDALRWGCTVPVLFNAMLVSSMYAMRHNTLGTISVFRNVAPLITLCIERAFRVPIEIDRDTILSLLAILVGVVLYHFTAIHISSLGLTAICVNIVFAVLERLLQRHLLSHVRRAHGARRRRAIPTPCTERARVVHGPASRTPTARRTRSTSPSPG
jgi:drug/metabolite transporter (DMT)-like permease